MDYLRRTKISLPEGFYGQFPDYGSLRVGLHNNGPHPNPDERRLQGTVYVFLVPTHGGGTHRYREVGHVNVSAETQKGLADEARRIARHQKSLKQLLTILEDKSY